MVVKNRVHAAQNGSLASYNQLRCYQQLPLGPELYCNQLRTITHFTFLFGALFGASDDPLWEFGGGLQSFSRPFPANDKSIFGFLSSSPFDWHP